MLLTGPTASLPSPHKVSCTKETLVFTQQLRAAVVSVFSECPAELRPLVSWLIVSRETEQPDLAGLLDIERIWPPVRVL